MLLGPSSIQRNTGLAGNGIAEFMKLTRRKFMTLLPGLLLASSVKADVTREADLFLINLGQWFSDHEALEKVARLALKEGVVSGEQLDALIAKLHKHYKAGGEKKMRAYLAKRIERDFEQEQTKVIDGWVFAETEAALSVLANGVKA